MTSLLELDEPDRIGYDLAELAEIVDDSLPGFTRQAMTSLDAEAREWTLRRMKAAGLHAYVDAAANVIGILEGDHPGAGIIMTGSHTDTVEGGGRYDGNVGVAAALEVVRTLRATNTTLRHTLMVVAFFNEEPNRFGQSCIGSRAMVGEFQPADLGARDANGITFAEALEGAGLDPAQMLDARVDTSPIRAFVELHVEQGPHLEDQGSQIGLVTTITGLSRFRALFRGQADHAGTRPMQHRRDAGCAAAGTVLAVEAIASQHPDGRGTTGLVTFAPSAINVVTARAEMWGELRSPDAEWLATARRELTRAAGTEAKSRGVDLEFEWLPSKQPVSMTDSLLNITAQVTDQLGLRQSRLYSGAEHDAAVLGRHVPTSMIFIPSHGGRSHCPEEFTDSPDITAGALTLLNVLIHLDLT
ncbi:M20 family metallo-hydrolase [Phycicoccus sp.]|uniref:M20 family metallo-hydrolase n=1 Tax=Phycicoccus sp. TaxID=1902410 RepID=UPI002BA4963F|nr:M20 family metallo-hydrolase [Phycicoccus sp.]HMM94047.1 M20 family metallo-hydrolase [Phycicoccus sp.]